MSESSVPLVGSQPRGDEAQRPIDATTVVLPELSVGEAQR